MFLKATIQLTGDSIGTFSGGVENQFGNKYSHNHIAVFECELKAPPQLAMIDHTLNEYMMSHRINFRNWRLVDFDNYMKGNSYFAKQ